MPFRCKEDGQLSICGCACAAHSPHFGRLAREVCLSCIQAAPMGKVSQSPCLGREDTFAPAVTPPCGSPAKLAQASREQDTTDTIFDPPAFTLTCCSSQAVPMKVFLFTLTVFLPLFLKVFFHCSEDLVSLSLKL